MRIVVSGTHASGKTTLIDDVIAMHGEYERWSDPFEVIDDALDEPDASTFFEQLISSARRLAAADSTGPPIIAERGPIDFLAYLAALVELRRGGRSSALLDRGFEIAATSMRNVDLVVVLPLEHHDTIRIGDDEDAELRGAMNDALLELCDDPDLIGDGTTVIEVSGDRAARLAAVDAALAAFG